MATILMGEVYSPALSTEVAFCSDSFRFPSWRNCLCRSKLGLLSAKEARTVPAPVHPVCPLHFRLFMDPEWLFTSSGTSSMDTAKWTWGAEEEHCGKESRLFHHSLLP